MMVTQMMSATTEIDTITRTAAEKQKRKDSPYDPLPQDQITPEKALKS